MRNKITALIIDHDYLKHDYENIKTRKISDYDEVFFELRVLEDGKDIYHILADFKGVDCIITVGDRRDWKYLGELPFQWRRKWIHVDEFNGGNIAQSIINVFKGNISRTDIPRTFSFFTCTYKTSKEKLMRLYASMRFQTYNEWNWWILDDSPDDETVKLIESLRDPRITVIRNASLHGNIGFNKHIIAMAADGDWLLEVDHDDELTVDCLQCINDAIEAYPESDFIYSNALEYNTEKKLPIIYGEGWGWGEGLTKTEEVKGVTYTFSESPEVNPYSIRTIFAQPNHIRAWKKEFYHKIGGHNTELAVLDDMDLLIRTFLHGVMTKIDKVLYIQYQDGNRENEGGTNTQSQRFAEIQRTVWLLKERYDKAIHDRIIELGGVDDPWNEGYGGYSWLSKPHTPGQNILSNLYTI